VHVIWSGTVDRKTDLPAMIGPSVFITKNHDPGPGGCRRPDLP
jgi:hypothetical protein